ncbi:SPRY domain-containing SOCS box protein 3-like [Acanthaster planci]|uniref:SPRY domain-containing SOCS box protein 3 n=1 Tax=Acanthaster planci TaxID=133434 RepID=A0A8B7ZC22_ACAPL|nr:SPRY domain-containing SOCS box protein 3-like [Acanthaster planci]
MTNQTKKGSRVRGKSPESPTETDCSPQPSKRTRPSPSSSSAASSSASVSGFGAYQQGGKVAATGEGQDSQGLEGMHPVSLARDTTSDPATGIACAPQEIIGSNCKGITGGPTSRKLDSSTTDGREAQLSSRYLETLPNDPLPMTLVSGGEKHDDEGFYQRKERTCCTCHSSDGEHPVMKKEARQTSRNISCQGCILRQLDWVWNEEETSDACVYVLGKTGAQVCFHQDYSCGTAAARGTQPMSEGQHFWEIKMDSPVYGTAMMVGIGTKQIDLGQYSHTFCNMLGSDTNSESCGLSYTGRFYQGGSQGKAYCSKFGQGTVLGLHLDMWYGTLTYYKNGRCLGVATKGLLGKVWHPMISSTAARSSMCLQAARFFPSSLQFLCCRALRQAVPTKHSVLEALAFPPGLRAFLEDNLLWLLDSHCQGDKEVVTKGTQTDLSMATHKLSDVPLKRSPPDQEEGERSQSPTQ